MELYPFPYISMKLTTMVRLRKKYCPKEWRKIEVGLISYRTLTTSQADHFDLKLNNAVIAFVAKCKKKNNVQLCVYSEKKVKQNKVLYGSSVTNIEMIVSL